MARREPGPFGVMELGSVADVPRRWLARRHLGSVVGMRLTMVGCSGSIPGPHSAASCYLLEADGFRLVVDLGNGAVGALQRRGPSAARCPSRPPARFSTWASEPRGTPVLS